MDEQSGTEVPDPSAEGELKDGEDATEDEVEGYSMAISANFSIDISGVAKPPVPPVGEPIDRTPGGRTSTDPNPRVR